MTSPKQRLQPEHGLRKLFSYFENSDLDGHGRQLARLVRDGRVHILGAVTSHPLGDEWFDFCHTSLNALWEKRKGELYVARNPVTPEFLKVGMTRGSAESRVKELATAGVVGAYTCVQGWHVHDRYHAERVVHEALVNKGWQRHKEHFAARWEEVCPLVTEIVAQDRTLFERQGFDLDQSGPTTNEFE